MAFRTYFSAGVPTLNRAFLPRFPEQLVWQFDAAIALVRLSGRDSRRDTFRTVKRCLEGWNNMQGYTMEKRF